MKNKTVRDALTIYKNTVSILKKGYEQEKYRIEQISNSFLGDLIVRKVTSVQIATYRDQRLLDVSPKTKKTISTATVRLEMSLLSSFFDICRIELGFCDANPVSNVRKPKPSPGRDRRLTAREERLIFRYSHAHSNPEFYSIIVLALETAMRQGEILSLRWENINLKTRIAHLPETKNGSKRDVPLSLRARDVLLRLQGQSKGKVFNYTSRGIKSTWRFMRLKLAIEDLHFHDLRHEAVSRLFELGTLDMLEVAAISGHKSLSMLKRYTHLRAANLVRKLEGNKNKAKQAIAPYMIPYPAELVREDGEVRVRLLDFENLIVAAESEYHAIRAARDALLRKIIDSINDSEQIPQPDQYLDIVDEKDLIMIDPRKRQEA
ncbi:site-specific integrase [Methylotenera sp.]|uniref:site-specific integrase n=1 Tax=Methylotenera sp. TaxID=2051956 RepID=UPI002ED80FF0